MIEKQCLPIVLSLLLNEFLNANVFRIYKTIALMPFFIFAQKVTDGTDHNTFQWRLYVKTQPTGGI
jgi:hypothetical protein